MNTGRFELEDLDELRPCPEAGVGCLPIEAEKDIGLGGDTDRPAGCMIGDAGLCMVEFLSKFEGAEVLRG